jgi:hypothetical protein
MDETQEKSVTESDSKEKIGNAINRLSKPRFTAHRSKTGKASSSCSNPRGSASRDASPTYGWTRATPLKTRAPAGWKAYWDGRPRSCVTHPSRLRRR